GLVLGHGLRASRPAAGLGRPRAVGGPRGALRDAVRRPRGDPARGAGTLRAAGGRGGHRPTRPRRAGAGLLQEPPFPAGPGADPRADRGHGRPVGLLTAGGPLISVSSSSHRRAITLAP